MKRTILIILILCMAVPFSEAQLWKLRKWEVSAGLGITQFFGDIGGFSITKNLLGIRDISYLQTRFDYNGSIKYRITREINARISLTGGMLHATDIRGSNEGRDFEAKISIFETALLFEYYFIKNESENSYRFLTGKQKGIDDLLASVDCYAFTGLGGLGYGVKGNDALVTKGMVTGGFSAVIPVGLGATLIYSPDLIFGVELGARYAFTDYLDGYTSQYSRANDVYYLFNFTVTYKMKTGKSGFPVFR